MPAAFTDAKYESLETRTKRYEVADNRQRGLLIVVHPTGRKTWIVRFHIGGKKTAIALGSYPEMTLADARRRAKIERGKVDTGIRPLGARKLRREVPPVEAGTFGFHFEEYKKDYINSKSATKKGRPLKSSTVRETLRMYESTILPELGPYKLTEITKGIVFALLTRIKNRAPVTANRVQTALGHFFKYCENRELIVASPTIRLEKMSGETSRDRVLTNDEQRLFWKACGEEGYPFGQFYQLLLLTGARRSEIGNSVRSEFDLKKGLWTIPGARTKNHLEHKIHLSALAVSIIENMPRVKNPKGFMFCTNGESPSSGFSKAKASIEKRMVELAVAEAKERGDDVEAVTIANWRLHDLRRSCATGMGKLGIAVAVVERALNHVSGEFAGVAGTYQRQEYLDERRAAFEAWSSHIEALVTGTSAKILPLKRSAA